MTFFALKIVKIMIFCAKVVNMTTLIGPKWAHKQLIFIFTKYFEVSREPEYSIGAKNPPRGFGGFVTRSTTLHAERPEASAD